MIEPSFPVNAITQTHAIPQPREVVVQVAAPAEPKKKSRKKNKKRNKPSKWADQCMYAELLEMSPEDPWSSTTDDLNDSLPHDLETGWVAVAPVPVGKRCLAVTHQSSGVAGVGSSSSLPSSLDSMSTLFFFSAQHYSALSSPRKNPHRSLSIIPSPANSAGLHPRFKLARKRHPTHPRRRQVERAGRRRL